MESLDDILKRIIHSASPISGTRAYLPESDKPKSEPCAVCQGRERLRVELPVGHHDFGKVVPCPACLDTPENHRKYAMRYSELPPPLQVKTFESFKDRPDLPPMQRVELEAAVMDAQCYATGRAKTKWLILGGSVGWGKTHLAAAILNHRIANPGPATGKYVNVPALLDHLRDGFKDDTYQERFHVVLDAPLLVLDDIGAHNATEWTREKLYQILDHRYAREMETVVTTNTPPQRLDERIADRLQDYGTGLVNSVFLTLPSYRTGAQQ